MESVFSKEQLDKLNSPLNPSLIKTRKGGGGKDLSYLEGHVVIAQAHSIFGPGNWAYRALSCIEKVIIDPATGKACGVMYKAEVELVVRGAVATIVEIGSQVVSDWSVTEVIRKRREAAKRYNKPYTISEEEEDSQARSRIADAHEVAEKGCVTDGLKRCLKTYGMQFGLSLYGEMPADEPSVFDAGIKRAKKRALALGAARDAADWQALLASLDIDTIATPADLAAVNAHLDTFVSTESA
jgi:hypothetical protein